MWEIACSAPSDAEQRVDLGDEVAAAVIGLRGATLRGDCDLTAAARIRAHELGYPMVTGTTLNATQPEICEVVQFLADKGAPLDEKDARGRTPIAITDVLPIDKAVDMLTQLILKSGANRRFRPKVEAARTVG